MAYNQKFGPNRKGSKHGKDMISRIMSGKDTAMSPLDNSVQYLKGMSGAMNGQKGMDGYSYGVPAEKLKSIQGSEGMSRKTKGQAALDGIGGGMSRKGSRPDYIDIDGDGDKKESMKSAADGMSRYKSDAQRKAAHASMAEKGMSRHKAGHQGYNDKLDESLAKDGKESTKEQSMKDRRDESKGMEKSKGKRAYKSDPDMDKTAGAGRKKGSKQPTKPKAKGNPRGGKFPPGINPKAKKTKSPKIKK